MKLNDKPFIGILAFIIVLFVMPVGHIIMVVIEKVGGQQFMYPTAIALGIVGTILIWFGSMGREGLPIPTNDWGR